MLSSFLPRLTASFLLLAFCLGRPALSQVNVLTQHNDLARTGANLSETRLTTSNVNAAGFGRLFSRSVDSLIWTQPLVLSGVSVPGVGTRSLVYVGTENASLYAFDAEDAAASAPIWQANLAAAPYVSGYRGIVGTPVIDAASKTLYVVANIGQPDGSFIFRLHALDVATGRDKTGSPVVISGAVPGTGVGSAGGVMTFNPAWERQRPGLLLLNGNIYIAFGSNNGEEPGDIYYGWLFSYNAATLQRTGLWCGAPDGLGSTLWASGQAPTSDGSSLYVMTGNGRFSASSGGKDFGDSFLRFKGDGKGLSVADSFTPFDEDYMDRSDSDLGSAGPLLLPGTDFLVGAGKKGTIYVVNRQAMGGHRLDNDSQIVQTFPAFNGHFHGSAVTWQTPSNGRVIYGWSEEDQLKVFKFANGKFETSPVQRSAMSVPPGMPGGFLSVSANGTAPGSGILWAYHPYDGDANPGIVNGILRAFDANNVSKELWNSRQNLARDDFGKYAKFNYVTIANGKVYVPTFSGKLVVYGLLGNTGAPPAPTSLSAVAGDGKITLTWRASAGAASYTLKRATTAAGPFSAIASGLTDLSRVDASVVNNTTYFYVVTASSATGESAASNVASATPKTASTGSTTQGISLNFIGGGSVGNSNGTPGAMASSEIAGVARLSFWNSLPGNAGSKTGLVDSRGAATSASVNWAADGIASTPITENPGNARLMKGYLNATGTNTTSVTVSQVPAAYLSAGYDVYVLFDGDNLDATRSGKYSLGTTSVVGTDSGNTNFSGTWKQANNGPGNYVRFKSLKTASFTLYATPGATSDAYPRAAISGLQIIPLSSGARGPSVAITAPLNGAALRVFPEIKGTATDNSGVGLSRVDLSLWHLKADKSKEFWNGSAWTATSTALTTSYNAATKTWTRSSGWPSDSLLWQGSYGFTATASDKSGLSAAASGAFVFDSVVPVVRVTLPATDTTQSALNLVNGTATDPGGSGVVRVDVVIVRESDGQWWSYTKWVDFETGIDAVLSGQNWSCNANLPPLRDLNPGQYLVKGIAYDRAGNVGGGSSSISIAASASSARSAATSSHQLSSALARVEEDNVSLFFTGALNGASAGDISHFRASVNGKTVKIEGLAPNPDNNSVLLIFPEGTLSLGDRVEVKCSGLRDFAGAPLSVQTASVAAL